MNETTCLQLLWLWFAYCTSGQQSIANKLMRTDITLCSGIMHDLMFIITKLIQAVEGIKMG